MPDPQMPMNAAMGGGDAAPDLAQGPTPQVLPMTPEQVAQWKGDLDKALEVSKKSWPWWDANLKAYAPQVSDDPNKYGNEVNTNRDFTLVERKKADLFYQQPDVQAIPTALMAGQEATLDSHTQILQQKLGVHNVDVKDLVHRLLFDVLCTAGTGFSVMGYESATVNVPTTDPMTGQPTMAPVPVFEDFFWRAISMRQAIIPATFRSTRWDDAPFLGYRFELPTKTCIRKGWVPDGFTGTDASQDLYFDHGLNSKAAGDQLVRGSIIFYKSALYRDDRPHPQHQTMLVFIEGIDQPVEHKDSPYQTMGPDGKLTPDSLVGFPLHPLTIRTLTDSAYISSDCTISRPLVNELNVFRGQMVQQRDGNVMRFQYNTDVLPTDALAKIVRSPIAGMIGMPGEAYTGEGAIKELPHGTFPRENFSFNDYIDHDLSMTHAIDANQAGVQSGGDETATEASLRQTNANARLGLERGIVLDWYIRGVTKYSTLVQRFLSVQDAAVIVGQQNAAAWDTWRHTMPAAVAFTALPDAALRNDLATERKRAMDEYTYFANDPYVDRGALLKHLLPKLHYPLSVLNQQPPSQHPEPPKLTLSIAATDLDPTLPNYGNVYQVLTQMGIQNLAQPTLDPMTAHVMQAQREALAAPQTQHGGKVAQTESLSKHQNDKTGGMNGIGAIQ